MIYNKFYEHANNSYRCKYRGVSFGFPGDFVERDMDIEMFVRSHYKQIADEDFPLFCEIEYYGE